MSAPLLAAALLATAAGSSHAADPGPLITDRPDVTESPSTLERGRVQIEAGYNFVSFDLDGETVEVSNLPASLVRVGLTPGVELRLEWLGVVSESREVGNSRSDESGSGNTALGAKIKLRDERGAAPRLAILVDAVLPTGSRSLRTERIDPGLRLAAGHTLSERLGLGYNLGVVAASLEDGTGDVDTHGLGRYSVSLGIGVTERWGSFVELFGFIPISGPERPANLIDAGFTYLASDSVQLDFSGGVGLSDQANDWFVGAGISIRLPR